VSSRKYIDIFAREAEEHLQLLRQGLLALEKEGFSAERVHVLLRSAHTLKGSARMLDLTAIGQVGHAMEDLLKEMENGARALTPAITDLLLAATDILEGLVGQAQTGGEVTFNIDNIVEGLRTGVLADAPAALAIEADKAELTTVRTSVAKLDDLVNLLGEMLISRRMLEERRRQLGGLMAEMEDFVRRLRKAENVKQLRQMQAGFSRLASDLEADIQNLSYLTQEMHHGAMELRMLPFSTITEDLARMVRNLAREQGKEINLTISGGNVELDRLLLEALKPMLLHMLRNSVDHGIETPEERQRTGKTAVGRIDLVARYEAGFVRLRLSDDGRGIDPVRIREVAVRKSLLSVEEAACLSDEEAVYLILRPGFSTREFITDVSGRGVGMDVVKTNIDRVKGNLVIHSTPGVGCEMQLQLPLTLAVITGMLIECEREVFALPLHYLSEILRLSEGDIHSEGGREVVRVHGATLPLVSLGDILGLGTCGGVGTGGGKITALVLTFREQRVACLVGRIRGVQELVVKGMGKQLKSVEYFSGVTILGDGSPALILSVPDLFGASLVGRGTQLRQEFAERKAGEKKGRILVVDDSITTRTMEKNILETQGYTVTIAISGEDALLKVAAAAYDLVVSDVEMPGITGFELTAKLRQMEGTRDIPVIIVSSLALDEHRRKGLEVGAQAYIVKGSFDQGTLLETVQTLIG